MRERRVTIDFETRSPIDIKFGSQRYSEDPRTDVNCLQFRLPDEPEPNLWAPAYENIGLPEWDEEQGDAGKLVDLHNEIYAGTLIEAHNSSFERAIYENIMVPRFGWPEIRPEQWRCSASVAAANSLPRSLDGVSGALGLPGKDAKGHRLMLKLSKPRGVVKADLEYAAGLLFGDPSRWKEIEKPKTVFQLLETINHIAPERGYRVQGVEGIAHLNPWHEKPEELERLFSYCKNDVMVEHAVSEKLGDGLSEQELKIWQLDQTMNFRGIHLDMELVDAALALTDSVVADGNERLFELTGGEVSTTGQQAKLRGWINSQPNTREEGVADLKKATVAEALRHPEWWSEGAYEALGLRRSLSMTSTSKYKMMAGAVCKDSRVRGTLYYHGTDTGRWAGRGIQPQNFPRGTIKAKMDELCDDVLTQDKALLSLLYGDPMEALSSALRGAICAAPGSELVSADYSAIEARGIFWLAGDEDALEVFSSGGDIYKEMAVRIYNVPISEVTNDMRYVGKTAILGLGYGMGHMRFREQVGWQDKGDPFGSSRPSNSVSQAQRIVDIYRTSYPKVPAFWKALNNTAMLTVETGRTTTMSEGRITMFMDSDFLNINLPSGRNMKYYKPKVERLWSERFENWQKKLTFMAVNTLTKKYARWDTFGGRLAENVTSGMCRDIMAEAMLRAEDGGVYKPVLTVHDEILCEVIHPKGSVEEFEALMTESPKWADGFPIIAEGWKGLRYRK